MVIRSTKQQQGMTLIICMIVLVMLTLMGLGSIRDTAMEERMAGNMKNRNLAFLAAESALREAERFIESTPPSESDCDGTAGLYPQQPDVLGFMATSWAVGAAVRPYTAALPDVVATPVYIIECMASEAKDPSKKAGGSVETPFYRVTARAVGSTATAVVILQTIYRRP